MLNSKKKIVVSVVKHRTYSKYLGITSLETPLGVARRAANDQSEIRSVRRCQALFVRRGQVAPGDSRAADMPGETGGGGTGEGPSPPGPINSISWVGPGGTQYITKMGPFYFP